jgi:hypothetical protein
MTEEKWLAGASLTRMLTYLREKVGDRKNRLFNVACCRRIWHLYTKPAVRDAILVGERYADGQADREELRAALRTIHAARAQAVVSSPTGLALQAAGFVAVEYSPKWPLASATNVLDVMVSQADKENLPALREQEQRASVALLYEFFGNPFRPISLDPSCLSGNVRSLAAAIYEERSFEAMPILGDALEEAGCLDQAILTHCRSGEAHYRGCWLLDLILAKDR